MSVFLKLLRLVRPVPKLLDGASQGYIILLSCLFERLPCWGFAQAGTLNEAKQLQMHSPNSISSRRASLPHLQVAV